MENKEIALQITLKALEQGLIPKYSDRKDHKEDEFRATILYNSDMICDFYKKTLTNLDK